MFDGEAFGQTIVEAVSKSLQPLRDRITELEKNEQSLAQRVIQAEKQLAERHTVAGAHIDRAGCLILIYSNGTEKNLGTVTEKGEPGTDGKDGFDLTNLDIQLAEDGRTLTFLLEDEHHKAQSEITLPTMIYRGVWSDEAYRKGDTVTYQGSLFVALADTSHKPGTSSEWQLAAKRGRDGKGV